MNWRTTTWCPMHATLEPMLNIQVDEHQKGHYRAWTECGWEKTIVSCQENVNAVRAGRHVVSQQTLGNRAHLTEG